MFPVVPLMLMIAPIRTTPVAPLPGEQVVRHAYELYGGKWFKTLTFVQRTSLPLENRVETWYEALRIPGEIRIDVGPAVTGRALIYRHDSTYQIGRGELRAAAPGVQPLLVLLHDLHSAPPEQTIAMLKQYGFNLAKTYESTWDGAKVIVVGALPGDTVSNQFWLEKTRLVLVRMIERNGSDPLRPLDARIGGYQQVGNAWMEHKVQLILGGQMSTVEDYTNVSINPVLEPDLFEPVPYRLPRWVQGGKDLFGGVPNTPPGGH